MLWKKVMSGLSAGRVQSVATRLVVDRERERMAFRSAAYWDLEATFDAGEGKSPQLFPAKLTGVDGRRVAQGRDFTSVGTLKDDSDSSGPVHLDEATAGALARRLRDQTFSVSSVESKPYRRSPAAPFRTTTLPAGGLAQARLRRRADHADRAAAVRERLHHLYADRLDHVVGHGGASGAFAGDRAVRPRVPAGEAADLPRAR